MIEGAFFDKVRCNRIICDYKMYDSRLYSIGFDHIISGGHEEDLARTAAHRISLQSFTLYSYII